MMISDINKSIFNQEYYSDLDKTVKHLAWILKLKSNWQNWERNKKHKANLKYVTISEIEEKKLEFSSINYISTNFFGLIIVKLTKKIRANQAKAKRYGVSYIYLHNNTHHSFKNSRRSQHRFFHFSIMPFYYSLRKYQTHPIRL